MTHEEIGIPGDPSGRTAEKAREARQPATLHFVTVAVTPSRAHLPVRKAEQESSIRSHVMKDYLQQKIKSSKHGNTLPAVSKLSDHLIQFRLDSRGKRKRSSRETEEVSSDKRTSTSASGPIKTRTIMPKGHQPLRDVMSARSLAKNTLSKISSQIDTSTPEALGLLEYYHHSFWDNSLAVNPEGQWMSVAASDAVTFHATLCIVALHKVQTRGGPQTNSYFWHRGEAMRLISQNLADPEHATSDATIGAVAVLSANDNSMHWPSITQTSHIEGMFTLVGLRGGIDGMNTNRHIQRVVAWADVLHATAHNARPQLGISQSTAHREKQRLKGIVRQHQYSSPAGQDIVPAYFQKALEDLQVLTMAKSRLMKDADSNLQELRQIFSSLLFVTEYSILELGHTAVSSDSVVGEITGVEVVKAAALIFTFHALRDIAITAAFFDSLVPRLQDGLRDIFDYVFQNQNPGFILDKAAAAPFLLWLCLTGWKASATKARDTHREFFVDKAAVLCENADINSSKELCSQVGRIVFMDEYDIPACGGLWADINTWTASRDIDWEVSQQSYTATRRLDRGTNIGVPTCS